MKLQKSQQELYSALHDIVRTPRGEPILVVVTGDTGSGKSMLLRAFARSLAITDLNGPATKSLLAIPVPLQDLQTSASENLWEEIARAWLTWANSVTGSSAFDQTWIKGRLGAKPTVLVLDSVDEFLMNHPRLQPAEIRRMVFDLQRRYRSNAGLLIVLGIRSSEPVLQTFIEDAEHILEIRNLTREEALKYFPDAEPVIERLSANPLLLEILLSPLLLAALTGLVAEDLRDTELRTPSDVVDLAITTLIKTSHLTQLDRTERQQTTVTDWKNALTLLALMYSARHVAEMSHEAILEEAPRMRTLWQKHSWPSESFSLAEELARAFDTITSEATMRPLMTRSLFFPTRLGAYRFKHRQWQDFLFGRYLSLAIEAENLDELMRGAFHSHAMRTAGEILLDQGWTGVKTSLIDKLAQRMALPKGQWAFGNFGGLLGNSVLPIEKPAIDLLVARFPEMPRAGLMTFFSALGTRILRRDSQDRSWTDLLGGLKELMSQGLARGRGSGATGQDKVTASISWHFLNLFANRFGKDDLPEISRPGLTLSAEEEKQALDQLLAELQEGRFLQPPAADYQTVQSAYLALIQQTIANRDEPRTISAAHYLFMLHLAVKHGVAIDQVRDELPVIISQSDASSVKLWMTLT